MAYYPFPDKILAREELKRDLLYNKIPESDRDKIIDYTWNIGETIAIEILNKHGINKDIYAIAEESGLQLQKVNSDRVVGNLRFFSEYLTGESKIVLYCGSINKWAEINKFTYQEAEELILSHEYFHYLEYSYIGELSKTYKVPTIKIGLLILSRSGIKALSEIGAHGFAYTYWNYRKDGKLKAGKIIKNSTINLLEQSKFISPKSLFNIKWIKKKHS